MGLVYGSQKPAEKEQAFLDFCRGNTVVLVSTTVVEVGMDVPRATTMVVEDAESFGLAQLHQLRGRVGRGSGESWCFLLGEENERLKILTQSSDGFYIAQKDLELRGPGEFFGTRQHGKLLDAYGINDVRLIEETRACISGYLDEQENAAQRLKLMQLAGQKFGERLRETGLH
jgi:ATP-dependent DNA helicase RecG